MKPRARDMTLEKWKFFIQHAQPVVLVEEAENVARQDQKLGDGIGLGYLFNSSSISVRYLQTPRSAAD